MATPASWRAAPRSPPPADRGTARWRRRGARRRRHGHHHQRIEARPGGDAGELGAGAAVITTSGSRRGRVATPGSSAPAPRSSPPADRGTARWRRRRAGGRRHGHYHQRIEARPGGDAGELGAGAAVITTSGSRRGRVATPGSSAPAPRSSPPADRGAAGWRRRGARRRRRGHHHQRIEARPGGEAGELVAGATVTTTSGSRRGPAATSEISAPVNKVYASGTSPRRGKLRDLCAREFRQAARRFRQS